MSGGVASTSFFAACGQEPGFFFTYFSGYNIRKMINTLENSHAVWNEDLGGYHTWNNADGLVEYRFTETSGNPGGTTSGWQTSPTYTDTGLAPNTSCTFTVQTRDANSTSWPRPRRPPAPRWSSTRDRSARPARRSPPCRSTPEPRPRNSRWQ